MTRPDRSRVVSCGFSLVEILVVVALLAIVGAGLTYHYVGAGGPGDKAQPPMTRARATVCMENLRSVRQAIAAAQMSDPDGKYPKALEALGLPAEVVRCDVGHEPYAYDPGTGQVSCVHPGHEGY